MTLAPKARFGAFEVLARLGAGGMGEVYRARDTRLDREVALKVLPPDTVTDDEARARLLREARLASKLNHPHVCTIHEVGEADGQLFIAMELVEGESLAERLAGGALPREQVLRYGVQIADALAHAHERGVVHRDLKSANIVLTAAGRAKVLDFGLAKQLVEKNLSKVMTMSQASLTTPGTVAGTLAYMAPEQLRGRPADARSDIWALGIVLYEMAAGRRPFQGPTGFALSAAILNEPPAPPPPAATPLVALAAILERCLAKEPGERFQRAGELRAALETAQASDGVTRVPTARTAVGAPSRRRWLAAAVALGLAATVALDVGGVRSRLAGGTAPHAFDSLAVLPFENLSGDPDQSYLAAGIHEALITELARLSGLERVIARASAVRYEKSDKPLKQVARELGVTTLMTGSVLRSGGRVRVTAHLIDPATDAQLWSDSFEREMRDVLALQNEIVAAITRKTRLRLTPREQARLATAKPVDPEAYEAYLKGRFHWYRFAPRDLEVALDYYRQVLEKEPLYAPAHSAIADVWSGRIVLGIVPPAEGWPRAKEAANRAVELDPSLAEAHCVLANVHASWEWSWANAEREYRRALELNPGYADAHLFYSHFLSVMQKSDEALAEGRRALELDPHNVFFQGLYGWDLLFARRIDDAIARFRETLQLQPESEIAREGLWRAYFLTARYEDALAAAIQLFAGDAEVVESLTSGQREAGYPAAMRAAAETLVARSRTAWVRPVRIAALYDHAGMPDAALEWLERAFEARAHDMYYLGADPYSEALRSDPRFRDLLRRLRLPAG